MILKFSRVLALILAAFLAGCFSQVNEQPEMVAKQEDNAPLSSMGAGQYVFRLFGSLRPFAALYDPVDGKLASIYKVVITSSGKDFWPMLAEDGRMTRESRYFAISRTITPSLFPTEAGPSGVNFRADIFRGSPGMQSILGRNKLVKIEELIFRQDGASAALRSHIIVGQGSEYHAVPVQADRDLLSLLALEGLTTMQKNAAWIAALLESEAGVPANTMMGCSTNYRGTISLPENTPENEIRAFCEKQGRAGPE